MRVCTSSFTPSSHLASRRTSGGRGLLRPSLTIVAMLLALVAGGCSDRDQETPVPDDPSTLPTETSLDDPGAGGGRPLLEPEPTPGVRFRLSDADPATEDGTVGAVILTGEALDAERIAELYARLPDLPEGVAQQRESALRAGPPPPAIAGDTLPVAFPPPVDPGDAAPETESGAAEVLRYQPEGDVPLASHLAVTFSAPMVALATVSEVDAADVPVSLEPQPEGRWRWVGTRTLLFEPDPRFPMATEYNATVDESATTADGRTLAAGVTWTFRTPPPSVTDFHPRGGPVGRSPVIVIAFDQAIDPAAVAPTIAATADGVALSMRQASNEELAADEEADRAAERAPVGRWLALVPEQPLPVGARIEVQVGPGVPSAEGPRQSEQQQSYDFSVYDALRVTEIFCGDYDNGPILLEEGDSSGRARDCRPLAPWQISFNNPLRADAFDAETITVDPAVPGMRIDVGGRGITLRGATAGRTRYEVTLPPSVADVFGQTLGRDVQLDFETGDAAPALFAPGDEMLALDPLGPRELIVSSINNRSLDVTVHAVTPADWPAYRQFARSYYDREGERPPAPGREVYSDRVAPDGDRDAIGRVAVSLDDALTDGVGHALVIVAPPGWSPEDDDAWSNRPVLRWVQSTQLAVDAFADGNDVLTWVTRLEDGASVAGAQVALEGLDQDGSRESSDSDGLARLPTIDQARRGDFERGEALLVATDGADSAFLRVDPWFLTARPSPDQLRWQVFDDRGLYRPDEQAALKGYLRRYGTGVGGDVERLPSSVEGVRWSLQAANGEEVASGSWPVDDYGSFGGEIDLPADIAVGPAIVRLTVEGDDGLAPELAEGNFVHELQVAEFRRPEFEVTVSAEQAEVVLGGEGVFEAGARYFAGGALPGADVAWTVFGTPASYSPPGWDGFTFGTWTPWWGRYDSFSFGEDRFGGDSVESWEARTDASGAHRLAVEFAGIFPLSPARFRAEATVQDVNRQAITGRDVLLAHPAEHYVGLRADGWFVEAGEEWGVDAVVTEIGGGAVTGSVIEVRAERLDGRWLAGEWREVAEPAGACSEVSGEGPIRCFFTFDEGGRYRVSASIVDDAGRANRSELTVWVPGGASGPADRRVEQETVELVPEAEDYQPGDTARILVRAPFAPAEALITWRRNGLIETERLRLSEPSTVIEVPIEESHVPGLTVAVDLVGRAPRDLPDADLAEGGAGADGTASIAGRPAFAHGEIRLPVPPRTRTLEVIASPATGSVRPGETLSVTVSVSDAGGAALPEAQVALIVVDEAVLSLTDHQIRSPIEGFYGNRPPGVDDRHFRWAVQLADPAALAAQMGDEVVEQSFGLDEADGALSMSMEMMSADAAGAEAPKAMMRAAGIPPPMTGGGGDSAAAPVVAERVDLNPLAAFVPDLVTDEDGRVSATIELPDNVTRYRITAVATDGARQFGLGEAPLLAELPLVVRPSAPRFLNFGDRFELPVVVQSRADEDRAVDVILRTANLSTTEAAGYRVTIPAGDRVEVRFSAAAELPGTAAFQAAAFDVEDESRADLQRVTLPVWTPATSEAFATYGTLDEGATRQPIIAPTDAVPGFGGLEITTSSTALAELSDAYLYLHRYPFEGSEQIASRLLANVALRDAVEAFGGEDVPTPAEVDASIDADLGRLAGLQHGDGGWGWWTRYQRSSPWSSIHAAHALVRAAAKDYGVDEAALENALVYLRDIQNHILAQPYPWSPETRRAAEAQALYVRAMVLTELESGPGLESADDIAVAALRVWDDGESEDEEPIETLGWLWSTFARVAGSESERDVNAAKAEIASRINTRATETASTAQFATGYSEEEGALILAGDRRADAVVLEALLADDPDNDLIPKLVRGLLDGRREGRWASTQDSAWILLAMDAYFAAFESEEPDFSARAWLGAQFAGEAEFVGRSPDRRQIDVPVDDLPTGESDLVLSKEGAGRLYYRLGLRYAPESLDLEPEERGFSVERSYEAIDDPEDVRRTADGTWEITAGARVRVRLTLVAPSRRYHVALVDPLPAGLEALNPDLATSETVPPPGIEEEAEDGSAISPRFWWGWRWYEHEGFRDDRVEIFSDRLWGGVWRYDYVARATTPGDFVAPPAKAEELYHPETFGRTGTDRVRVVVEGSGE